MDSIRDEENKISKLEQSLKDVEKFEKDIWEAIKDEKEAQRMYEPIAHSADNLSQALQQFSFSPMAREIRNIIRDETGHERAFASMFNSTQQYKRSLIDEIQKRKDSLQHSKKEEDERKRSVLKEGYHGPFRLRKY